MRTAAVRVSILMSFFLMGELVAGQDAPASQESYDFLRDRGPGIPTSLFGTYVQKGELLIYPFFEYYRDQNLEYSPAELGLGPDQDFRGRYRASEGLIFVGYGLSDAFAIELEAAVIDATFQKSPDDTSSVPDEIQESGLGDIQTLLTWRWKKETLDRPEFFSFAEVVFPHSKEKVLIGTPGWQVKVGTGVIRGFRWGTLTARGALEYDDSSSSPWDLGEYAIEYLRQVSPSWRLYAGIEGSSDELSLIGEVQWHLSRHVVLKLNSGFGLSSKATDWAPEVGILFRWPPREGGS